MVPNNFLRETIYIPDDQYRVLMSNAEKSRLGLDQLVAQLIEQGLRSSKTTSSGNRDCPPPVIVPPRGVPIPATSREELTRMEEDEERAQH